MTEVRKRVRELVDLANLSSLLKSATDGSETECTIQKPNIVPSHPLSFAEIQRFPCFAHLFRHAPQPRRGHPLYDYGDLLLHVLEKYNSPKDVRIAHTVPSKTIQFVGWHRLAGETSISEDERR